MDKKRILLISATDLGKSGVPTYLMNVVRSLSDVYTFDIVVFRDKDYFANEFLSYGGHIFKCVLPSNCKNVIEKIFNIFKRKIQIKKFYKKLLLENHYYGIHINNGYQSTFLLKIAKKSGIKKRIVQAHMLAIPPSNCFLKFIYNYNKNLTIKNATDLIAVSKDCGISFFDKHKFTVINPPLEPGKIKFYKKNQTKTLNLVQVGTYTETKNQLFSLSLLKILNQSINANLTFVGQKFLNDYYLRMIDFINNNHLTKKVKFLPFNSNLDNVFEKNDILLFPSQNEGFGIVLIEAQSAGLLCISSDAVPKETNYGNVYFKKLDIQKWEKLILCLYKNNKIKHSACDLNKLDIKNFAKTFKLVYKK